MKLITMSGAHRTGKSTLANALANRGSQYLFLPTEISKAPVWKNINLQSYEMTFGERITVQIELMDYLEEQFRRWNGSYGKDTKIVADRSPVDILSYLMANVDNTCSDLFWNAFNVLRDRTEDILNTYVEFVVLLRPGIPAVTCEEDAKKSGKTYMSRIYQETLTSICADLTRQMFPKEKIIEVPQHVLMLEQRLEFVKSEIFLRSL